MGELELVNTELNTLLSLTATPKLGKTSFLARLHSPWNQKPRSFIDGSRRSVVGNGNW